MENEQISLLLFAKNFMRDGGAFMWVILICWLLGIALSLFKLVKFKLYSVNGAKLFNAIKTKVLGNEVEGAIKICSNSKAILPIILKSALKRANEERMFVEDAVSSTMLEHTPKVTEYLSYIALIANVSTLIGLLGTIQGLIMSFAGVADADPGMKSKILSMGIAKAMNTTALGLISAITLMVIYTILSNKALKMNNSYDEFATKLVDLLSVKRRKVSTND